MFKRALSTGLILGVSATATLAQAQGNCAPRDGIVERLKQKYSERLVGGGLQNANSVLEVWSSDKTGSFTVLITHANGLSCVVSSGQNWSSVTAVSVPEDQAG